MTARFLAVKRFKKFQHYSDRNPPWIKLYTELLVDPDFIQLAEVAQAQLMKLWLLRAQLGSLPNNPKLLAGKIGATGKFHISALIASGFLVPTDDPEAIEKSNDSASADAKESLAPPGNNASKNGAKSPQNATGSVPAHAHSRESESTELEGDTKLPVPEPRIRFCAAANKGLLEHPTRPQNEPRVLPNSGKAYEATDEILAANVPVEFAESAIYDIARSHDADGQVTSLKYFTGGVLRLWRKHNASGDAKRSNPGALPTNGNGKKSWQDEFLEEAAARGLK
jgi:hypothetical protein